MVLNNMSEGKMTDTDVALLRTRVVNSKDVPQSAIRLFSTNDDTNAYNVKKLATINTHSFISLAVDNIKARLPEQNVLIFLIK